MKTKTLMLTVKKKTGRRVPALVVALALGPLLATCQRDQPPMLCATSIGTFAVKYTLIEGTGVCAGLTTGRVGVESYLAATMSDHPGFERPVVAIRAEEMGTLIRQYDAAGRIDPKQVTSTAPFADLHPADDGFCQVGAMNAATMALASVASNGDPAKPDLPAVDVRYEWTNLRFYVTTSSIGAQFSAELLYRKDGCTARYRAAGLYPAFSCRRTVTAPDGTMMSTKDEGLCSPCPDPSVGRARGSGIHPDVETYCDDQTLLCLPRADPPSLKPEHYICPVVSG